MGKFIIGLLVGALIGGALTFYFLSGGNIGSQAPGEPIRPPDPNGMPAGTAEINVHQEFFNEALTTIFRDMQPPVFPLGEGNGRDGECPSSITLLPEGSGVQTGVVLEGNNLAARLAFTGSYSSMFGCLRFTGWAPANLQLRYDQPSQTVFGQLNVETVNLDGVNPAMSVLLTPIVQSTLNSRVNPIPMMSGEQLGLNLPIAATQKNFVANVTDVRAEIAESELRMFITYEMSGGEWTGDAPPPAAP